MKKLNTLMQGAVGLMALGTVAAHAQDIQTVEIEGTVDNWWNYYQQGNPELLEAATFKFVVEQDIAATQSSGYTGSNYVEKWYNNNVYRLSFTFYDAQGVEIQTTTTTELTSGELDSTGVWARNDNDETYNYDYMYWWGEDYGNESESRRYMGAQIYDGNSQAEMFSDFSGYPLLLDAQEPGFEFYGWMNDSSSMYYYNEFWGTVTSIVSSALDDDEDGFANDVDNCSLSIMDATVEFDGWHDSGVTNYVDANGCTVMDHYAACEVEEEEQSESVFGWFQPIYSGPSYCEKQVSYDLVKDGVINYSEARQLRDALYYSSQTQQLR